MIILTFVRPIDLVAPLNINGNFYNTTIIKQNNMTYKHKVIFSIWDGFGYDFGVGTYILVTRPIPVFWNREKSKPGQNGKNPSNWVWFGRVTTSMGFVVMPTQTGIPYNFFNLKSFWRMYINVKFLENLKINHWWWWG